MTALIRSPRAPWTAAIALSTTCLGLAMVAGRRATHPSPATARQTAQSLMKNVPLAFERNEGQTADPVKYLARGDGYTLFLTQNEAVLSLRSQPDPRAAKGRNPAQTGRSRQKVVRLKVVNASPKARVEGLNALPTHTSYYLGSDPKQWKRDVPTYERVRFNQIYRGIDLVYYGKQGKLEYDFVVQPRVDPGVIRLAVEGAERLELEPKGSLLIHTGDGVVRQPRPIVYQGSGKSRREIEGDYVRLASGDIGFQVGPYDRNQALVIDPVIHYSTMIGGTGGEVAYAFGSNQRGTTVGGYTTSTDYPTAGFTSEDASLNGSMDAFLFQFDMSKSGAASLVSATYLGGSGDDRVQALVATGNMVYVAGTTSSNNFPVLSGYDSSYNGQGDAFVASFLSGGGEPGGPTWGMQLTRATYLGGSEADSGNCLTLDAVGVVVAGTTASNGTFPWTGIGKRDYGGGATDAFITALSTQLNAIGTSTFFGGSLADTANGLAADPTGSIFITGDTTSADFPTAGDPHQFQLNQQVPNTKDAYLAKLGPLYNGVSLVYSTYLGGNGNDTGYAVTADEFDQAYVTGETTSTNFHVIDGGQTALAGASDAFVCKAKFNGKLVYSTYLGGPGGDAGYAISPRGLTGQVAVGGVSGLHGLPFAYDGGGGGGNSDGFVSIIDTFFPNGQSVAATAYVGGGLGDAVYAVGADWLFPNRVFVAGATGGGIPFVSGYQGHAGGGDGFFAYMSFDWGPGIPLNLTPAPQVANPPNPDEVWFGLTPENESITFWRRTGQGPFEEHEAMYTIGSHPNNFGYEAWIDNDVAQGMTYTYVAHGNAPGYASNSWTVTTALKAPTNLTATAATETQINLAWTNNAYNHTHFGIQRKTGSGGTYATIASVPFTASGYNDSGLNTNTTYYYKVYAYNAAVQSPLSNEANATVQTVPAAPSNLSANVISTTQVDLAWSDNSNNETGFKIEWSTVSNFSSYSANYVFTPNTTSYSVTGLSPSTLYHFRVRSVRAGIESPPSNVVSKTTFETIPSTPTNLVATALTANQIRLNWTDASNSETGFKVERSTTNFGSPVLLTTTVANATVYYDNTVNSSSTYYYRIRATNALGDSGNSNVASATTPFGRPAAPSNLIATTVSASQINLTWTDNSTTEASFNVERSQTSDFSSGNILLAITNPNVTSFSDTNTLSPNTTYYYRVWAANSAGLSDPTNIANATTLPLPPNAPSNLTATPVSQTQINVAWTDNSNNETGFRLERSLSSNFASPTLTTLGANVTSANITGLTLNTTYYFRVRAYNTGGESSNATSSAATHPNPPVAASNLSASVMSQTQINLTWTDNSSNETGFEIQRSGSPDFMGATLLSAAANATQYADTGLQANTLYYYRMRAFNLGGYSSYSSTINRTTLPNPPAAPGGTTPTQITQTSMVVNWVDYSNNETAFEVQQSTDGSSYSLIASVGANTTSTSVTGLTANTLYYFRVRATNSGGASDYALSGAYTLPNPPAAPSGLVATASTGQISLVWVDNSTNESGFEIERSDNGTTFTPLTTTSANVTSYVDSGVPNDATKYYRIRAWNSGGASAFAAVDAATTPTVAPTNLLATVISNSRIDLTWNDNSNSENNYKLERCTDNFQGGPITTITLAANVTSYSNTGLPNGTTYYYRVYASTLSGGNSDYSNVEKTRTSPPADPTGLVATAASNSQIDLLWNDISFNETEYRVLRSGNGETYTLIATLDRNTTSYSATGLQANKKYWFKVRAVNGAGDNVTNVATEWTLP